MEDLRSMAILDKGRQKPMDTFARESVRLITGKENFEGFDPNELLISWLTLSQTWEQVPLIKIDHRPLVEHLQLVTESGRISPKNLRENQEFQLFLQSVSSKQQEGQNLNELEREGGRLGEKLQHFYQIAQGTNLNLYPRNNDGWESLAGLAQRFPQISLQQASPTPDAKVAAGVQGMLSAYYQNNPQLFHEIAFLLNGILRQRGEEIKNYPTQASLTREIHLNRFKPFRLAWIGYSLAAFLLALSLGLRARAWYWSGMVVLILSFGLQLYGFILRILIAGRPPVTNMYETVLWVPFGAVLFGIILEIIYRKKVFALASAAVAALCLIVADSAPSILDPAINPLVPVLRNNFWLTIHVLTITLSYGAFTLALGVANLNGGFYIFAPHREDTIKSLNLFIYRALQIGVILLAAGTILGGVWANQSWGRFWGWDPKEVWALIALLGYLVILHGRFIGWIKGVGLTVGTIVAYLLVLMAWYGVNFILGVGLHSYGFSSGGAKFVTIFTGVQLLWVTLILFRTKNGGTQALPRNL
ncbi:MAG: cytochrome c biogenesis protein CcsA [bacterium]|nr:cytochrome c biogenesis protein CcsA [bacterium]